MEYSRAKKRPTTSLKIDSETAKLAWNIIADSFGHDPGLVCSALLRLNHQTLRVLVKETVHFVAASVFDAVPK